LYVLLLLLNTDQHLPDSIIILILKLKTDKKTSHHIGRFFIVLRKMYNLETYYTINMPALAGSGKSLQ